MDPKPFGVPGGVSVTTKTLTSLIDLIFF